MHIEATDWGGLEWNNLAQDRNRRGVLADLVLNFQFSQEEHSGLSS
jgi:hypothetical protein